ncbi:MAG: hypothetical protein WC760_03795 [Bacteroidia bacterium]|jgi:hypothetical protein
MGSRNKISASILLFIFGFILSGSVFAQRRNTAKMNLTCNIPAIALVDFASSDLRTVTYNSSLLDPNQVEQLVSDGATDGTTWINYSSIVRNGTTNYITAEVSSGELPGDMTLNLYVSPDNGEGAGSKGTACGQMVLTSYPQIIISNIGSCFTGRGLNRGHHLRYEWRSIDNENVIEKPHGNIVSVTYTISSTE